MQYFVVKSTVMMKVIEKYKTRVEILSKTRRA
jgi:hypothetical protein